MSSAARAHLPRRCALGTAHYLKEVQLIEVTLRILLVEDDERGFAATEALLDGIPGFHPVRAPSLSWASSAVRGGGYDVVLVGESAPGGAVVHLTRELGALGPGVPPVVVLLAGESGVEEVAAAGAAAALPRGEVTPAVLRYTLRHAAAAARPAPAVLPACDVLREWDVASGAVLWTETLHSVFGYPTEQVEPTLEWWAERVHPDDRARARATLQAAAAEGGASGTSRYRFRQGNGGWAEVVEHAFALRGAGGAVKRVVGSIRCATSDGAALREEEERSRLLLELLPEAVLVHSGGVVVYVNPAALALLGASSAAEVVGRRMLDLLHAEYRDFVAERIRGMIESGAPVPLARERLVRGDGGTVEVEVIAAPITYGGTTSVLVVARDISERLRLEEQLRLAQRMEAVGRLAGGVAHDFNNLLTAIKGNADLLAMDIPHGSPMREDVAEIQGAAARAAELTRQLLAFGRGQVLQPRLLDPNAAITASIKILRRLLPRNVEIETALDEDAGYVRADPTQLDQILLNLALNARDAMPDGGTVRLETGSVEILPGDPRPAYMLAGEYVRICVTDSGHGMDDLTRERVFEPFFTTRGSGNGTGLGLSTVYGIVKQSGGYIWVESAPGNGTTFRILLPRVGSPDAPDDEAAPPRPESSTRGTVLLVEDEDPVRRVTARVLRRSGFAVIEARDGHEALEVWADHHREVDAVLTDLVMPRMGGREFARLVRASRPELPVLFMSGYMEGAALSREALDPGAELLHKPFDPDVLTDRLGQLLDRKAGIRD
ncbi:MAG TPA: PAS domain S-box protein [Longimicrobium sp.]|nr:PAS domain S-box protein [Longimicrobium sp.]